MQVLAILFLASAKVIGQEQGECSINSLEWKKIVTEKSINLKGINRIDLRGNKMIENNWYDTTFLDPIGKSMVSTHIFKKFNTAWGIDTIGTPFMIYYQNGLSERPEAGNWLDSHIFTISTGEPIDIDWHTIVIASFHHLGFQIFFEGNYFKSRMFLAVGDKGTEFIKPYSEKLFQSRDNGTVKGKLISAYYLNEFECDLKKMFEFDHDIDEVEIIIEYEYNISDLKTN